MWLPCYVYAAGRGGGAQRRFCCVLTACRHANADTMGTVHYSHRVDSCPQGSTVCHEDELEINPRPTTLKRHLRNVFLGIKLAVLPTPDFQSLSVQV